MTAGSSVCGEGGRNILLGTELDHKSKRGIRVAAQEGQSDFKNQRFERTEAEQRFPSSTGVW